LEVHNDVKASRRDRLSLTFDAHAKHFVRKGLKLPIGSRKLGKRRSFSLLAIVGSWVLPGRHRNDLAIIA